MNKVLFAATVFFLTALIAAREVPVSECAALAGFANTTFVLQRDITFDNPWGCFWLMANDNALDCRGHSLTYNGTLNGVPAVEVHAYSNNPNARNINVSNCVIKTNQVGVSVYAVDGAIIKNVLVKNARLAFAVGSWNIQRTQSNVGLLNCRVENAVENNALQVLENSFNVRLTGFQACNKIKNTELLCRNAVVDGGGNAWNGVSNCKLKQNYCRQAVDGTVRRKAVKN